jgi:hypothetical protein
MRQGNSRSDDMKTTETYQDEFERFFNNLARPIADQVEPVLQADPKKRASAEEVISRVESILSLAGALQDDIEDCRFGEAVSTLELIEADISVLKPELDAEEDSVQAELIAMSEPDYPLFESAPAIGAKQEN